MSDEGTKKVKKVKKVVDFPPIHCILYGDPGSFKTTMLATFPTPLLVLCFDAGTPKGMGKDSPLKRRFSAFPSKVFETEEGVPAIAYMDGSKVVCQIEYYHDPADGEKATAFPAFRRRMARFVNEGETGLWKTIGVDSITSMNLSAFSEQAAQNPGDPMKWGQVWRGGTTDALERYLVRGFSELDMNVVLLAHIQEETVNMKGQKGGMIEYQNTLVRSIAAPGRLARGKRLFSQYSECYRLFIQKGENGFEPVVQTESDDEWVCMTQIGAPNLCRPTYKSIWSNFNRTKGDEE